MTKKDSRDEKIEQEIKERDKCVNLLKKEDKKETVTPFDKIIGSSGKMKDILNLIKKVAESDVTTVLIEGESGTGKDLLARVIHDSSKRREFPFMEINCAALPETLLESELLGYEKGAFTDANHMKKGLFEIADGGTVYLDEIGDLKKSLQVKLLRLLETKRFKRIGSVSDLSVNVRIVAATNKNLRKAIDNGQFRDDLFYRLNVVPITVPPLRDRRDDILNLTHHFISIYNKEFNKEIKYISNMAKKFLEEYYWPGNVRELKNVIERAIVFEEGDTLLIEDLHLEMMRQQVYDMATIIRLPPQGLSIKKVEMELIRQALEVSKGCQIRAAKLLDLTRDSLRYKMKKFGLL
ncbi:MAG: sigma 54-interacting transcriptional regulator [bacterium]